MESPADNKAVAVDNTLDNLQEYMRDRLLPRARDLLQETYDEIIKIVNNSYEVAYKFSIHHSSQRTLDIIGAFMQENLELIEDVIEDFFASARITLLHSIGAFDRQSVMRQIEYSSDVTTRRAELIARDQIAKATERYSQAHAMDLGFQYYLWQTSQDSRVSTGEGGHDVLNQRIYKYGEPTAIIDTKKTKGIPGQRTNCRCNSVPLITEPGQVFKLIKDKEHGDYYVTK